LCLRVNGKIRTHSDEGWKECQDNGN